MNVAASRRLAESLEKYGLTAADGPHDADVVVLYSCVVRQQAEDRESHRQGWPGQDPALRFGVIGGELKCISDDAWLTHVISSRSRFLRQRSP